MQTIYNSKNVSGIIILDNLIKEYGFPNFIGIIYDRATAKYHYGVNNESQKHFNQQWVYKSIICYVCKVKDDTYELHYDVYGWIWNVDFGALTVIKKHVFPSDEASYNSYMKQFNEWNK